MSPATHLAPLRHSPLSSDGAADATLQFTRPLDVKGRAVLLASDGSEPALAAAHVAFDLAKQHHAIVHVVNVVDTRSAPLPPPLDLALAMGDVMSDPAIHHARNEEILAGISASLGKGVAWPVRTMIGTPASAIVEEAERLHAALIVVGLRRHHGIDRVFRDDTTLEVMRHATCPVVGVAEQLTQLPHHVLVAMDFSDTSRLAASAACGLAAAHATVVLAYVSPLECFLPDDGDHAIHRLGVQACFARTTRDLHSAAVSFDQVVLHHVAPRSKAALLLEEADNAKAELICIGSANRGRMDRWIMGSVSEELARDGRWSMLVVPPRRSG